MPVVCVDTNVWFYALARPAQGEIQKHLAARELIDGLEQPVVTPQIVNELSTNLLRKRSWSEAELRGLIADMRSRCRYFVPDSEWHEQASLLRERHGLSFWDSLVVASALAAGSDVLASEDMQHGIRIDTLSIANPFTPT